MGIIGSRRRTSGAQDRGRWVRIPGALCRKCVTGASLPVRSAGRTLGGPGRRCGSGTDQAGETMSLGDSVVRPARASSVRSAGPTAVAKPKAHLILGCTPSAAGTIADYTTRLGGNSRVISNDPELVE